MIISNIIDTRSQAGRVLCNIKRTNQRVMNSSATCNRTPCQIYSSLGGILDESTTEAYAVLILLIVLGIIISPVMTGLNALVMIAVKTKPRLKTTSNIALGCLAATDCLMGLIGLPMFILARIFTLQATTSSELCILQDLSRHSLRVLGGATVLHLILMNIERYLAIKHSFKYVAMVTELRMLFTSALMWVTTLLVTIPLAILNEDIYLTVNNIILLTCMAIMIFCQVVVYLETCRHAKQIAAHQFSEETRQKFLKEKKAFKLTTTVLVTQLITYVPIFVVRICLTNSVISSKNGAYIAFFIATFVLILNSLINPIIYCVRTRQFRVAFTEILFNKQHTSREQPARFSLLRLNAVAPKSAQQRYENKIKITVTSVAEAIIS